MWEIKRNPKFDELIKGYKMFPISYLMRWDLLMLLIRQYRPKKIAEVGVYEGATAARILREHKSCFGKRGLAMPIDFEHYYMIDHAPHKSCKELEKQYKGICTFIVDKSVRAVKRFENKSLDLVFVDATHWYKDAKEDLEIWLPKIKKGGWIVGHDFYLAGCDPWHEDVKRAANEVLGYRDYYLFPDLEPWGRSCTFMKRV